MFFSIYVFLLINSHKNVTRTTLNISPN